MQIDTEVLACLRAVDYDPARLDQADRIRVENACRGAGIQLIAAPQMRHRPICSVSRINNPEVSLPMDSPTMLSPAEVEALVRGEDLPRLRRRRRAA